MSFDRLTRWFLQPQNWLPALYGGFGVGFWIGVVVTIVKHGKQPVSWDDLLYVLLGTLIGGLHLSILWMAPSFERFRQWRMAHMVSSFVVIVIALAASIAIDLKTFVVPFIGAVSTLGVTAVCTLRNR